MKITMEYLNQFHKESMERCLRKIAEMQKHPIDPATEAAKVERMHADYEARLQAQNKANEVR